MNELAIQLDEVGFGFTLDEITALGADLGTAILGGGSIPDYYTGPYEVTPLSVEQFLLTKDKTLTDNLRVKMVQKNVTTNTAGGKTVNIGGEM